MKDLIARLEAAGKGCRELDLEIAETIGLHLIAFHYTTSLDAARMLIPKGVEFKIGRDSEDVSYASCGGPRIYEGATPALALCIATLKAHHADR